MADKRLPEALQVAADIAHFFGMDYIGKIMENLWGDPHRIDVASEVWAYLSSEIITKGTDHKLKNAFDKSFPPDKWSGEAKEVYRSWNLEFRRQTLDKMAARAHSMTTILVELSTTVRQIQVDLRWMTLEFFGAAGLTAGGAWYKSQPGKGAHAKGPGGAHAKGKASEQLAILLILAALLDFGRRLIRYQDELKPKMKEHQNRIEKLLRSGHPIGDGKRIVPRFPAPSVADPRGWRR